MANDRMLLAVLIDADNIPAKYAGDIMHEIKKLGEPALRRVYGDWSSSALDNWLKAVGELGMVANQETSNTAHKNASDIGLVIDAMDILHKGRFDGFVIVSSDSDFTALANRLREDGVEVIGIGEKKVPNSLRNACNRFILIENIIESEVDETTAKKPKAAKTVSSKHPPSKAVPLIKDAMKSMDPEADWFSLGPLGNFITRANPDFDPRTYGSSKLSDLLDKTGQFETRKSEGNMQVRRLL
ncbi:MAG: NYN domain-containing protein [Yoonia sp.]|uniref:NYN domain-containing protein n=1 Tax=Yoonia sp. TaxID=2212373 RepID=UPI003EF4479B